MNKVLFTGCSYVSGAGFALEKTEPGLWVNLLHQNHHMLKSLDMVNTAQGGRSNAGIFQDAAWHLAQERYKYAFVAWTSMPRYEMELGLETYDTRQCFIPNSPTRDHNLNDITYSRQYLDGVRDRFTSLPHLHGEIRNLVYYVNTLVNLADLQGTKIFFVNAICPWDLDYFDRLDDVMPNQTTTFTQQTIINLDNRDDHEFFLIYNKIHDEYSMAGGIQQAHWLNLYSSLRRARIDTNDDDLHPGLQSNQTYFNSFNQALQQMI